MTGRPSTAVDALTRAQGLLDRSDDAALVLARPSAGWLRDLAERIDGLPADAVPLRGTTFSIKDNIDLEGVTTTVACPSVAYVPDRSATVVERLVAAGALPVAKVNLDQFATGLVGTRSPYGTPRSPIDPALVPGGSSSGSGVSVATGLVDFSVGTDTAGSGRVPAAMCGIASIKPTPGRLSNAGVVPAVRSIDCPAVFARDLGLAAAAAALAAGSDPADPFSRDQPPVGPAPLRRLGVIGERELAVVGADDRVADGYLRVLGLLADRGFELTEIDPTPLFAIGDELYGGPWLVERAMAVDALTPAVGDVDPTVAAVLSSAASFTASDVHAARYRRRRAEQVARSVLDEVDGLAFPTVGWWPTLEAVAADPIATNAMLGRFTTFTNLVGLCAATVAVPEAATSASVPPPSVSIQAPAWADDAAVAAASRLAGVPIEPPRGWITLAVCGAHLKGQALDHQLVDRDAVWLGTTESAASYRLYAMDTEPPKPAMVHVGTEGVAIEVDLWSLSPAAFGDFVASIPPPLGIGTVDLAGGRSVPGFIAESRAVDGAEDITHFGGWRAYRAAG